MKVRPAPLASLLKKLLRVKRQVVEAKEGKFLIDPVSEFGNELRTTKGYEPETEAIIRTLKPSDVFVDVGANEAYFTVMAAKRCQRVIAVEPQPRLQSVIKANLELNDCQNVTVYECVISDQPGELELFLSSDRNTGSTSVKQTTRYPQAKIKVEAKTLPQILNGVERVDLLKLDVEGAEYDIILGSPDTFKSGIIKRMALEIHPKALKPEQIAEIRTFLNSCGYRITGEGLTLDCSYTKQTS